ncbi:MAG: hypothetical protein QOI11_3520, partial [Candidatus Eremiobacteraeota bacterium]|nr:hypothetical protein [Candidatus Eremiobacteraeota bacterium]
LTVLTDFAKSHAVSVHSGGGAHVLDLVVESGAPPAQGFFHAVAELAGTRIFPVSRHPAALDVVVAGHDNLLRALSWPAAGGAWAASDLPAVGDYVSSPLAGASRRPGQVDALLRGSAVGVLGAGWERGGEALPPWNGWFGLPNLRMMPGNGFSLVSRDATKLDAYAVDADGRAHAAAWDQNANGAEWDGWWPIVAATSLRFGRNGTIAGVARDPTKLDVFAVATGGRPFTAAWDRNDQSGDWRGWWPIADSPPALVAGQPLSAVARDATKLDVFAVDARGTVFAAAWDGSAAPAAWQGWWIVGDAPPPALPATAVTAVARDPTKLDLFLAGSDGTVYAAAWDANRAGGSWRGWWSIAADAKRPRIVPGSPVYAVSRDPAKLDIFAVGVDGGIYSAAYDASTNATAWQGWWKL